MIYHYTSIKSLAMILSSKSIRFTRLDFVDDPEERCFVQDGIDPSKYVFVSCWTHNQQENMPQWRLYGDNGHGIRIGLDDDVFGIVQQNGHNYLVNPIPYPDSLFILPLLNDSPLVNVEYVESPLKKKTDIFITLENGEKALDFSKVGFFKNKDWAFLSECRFVAYTAPRNKKGNIPNNYIGERIYHSTTFLDFPIRNEVFERMEIVAGPNLTKEEDVILHAIVSKHLGRDDITQSSFAEIDMI
ncbi:MAG: DUF2971 domain-containing protein [Bacteroidaceae bacterium]|nr:DUF2971 domain-containing protein [Bacteroidaceae bacterium]